MTNIIQDRAMLFSKYIGAELKGAIASHGYSQGKVADALGHARSAMSNWLNAKPPIDVAVANKICDYIGMDFTVVVKRAEQRVTDDLGPYPPLEVDPSQLSEDEKIQYVLDKIKAGDQTLVASTDPYKEQEKEGGDGR
ncbi:helix-turn-helix transcriptional regulator [Bifidobacterium sp. B4107]|uniref:helix-turn-helix domain-containing protein n=1 Tax=unclassified Bifidobacterium TaxID=2608897 RepID=UPI00226B713B|nr:MULTISPECIES: helix-turn-helix transcriptional regulator [unclassified Bifidobacterium]MCX8648176.1 helix-turn-helix transcriptional regulator [Bifidobacterium sp. B4107]MCX8652346.1 helix-turn-helix transcriptional regulator [Bifidobacterium sp. B4111]MCX8658777.1 helix-turn-helix transcriptional regulator [Bifidobacterium sp. B4114]